MAQTTEAVSQSCFKVEINLSKTCAAAWINISGESVNLGGMNQTRFVGDAYTFDGDVAITKGGKKQPVDGTVTVVYTEKDIEAFDLIRTYWEANGCGAAICLRWSPRGGNPGDQQYLITGGEMTAFAYPIGDAGAGGPVVTAFSVHGPEITTSIIAS